MVTEACDLLGLCMIVRDEAHGIAQTLRSFAPFVDRFTILDTGSTDGTQEVVRQTLEGVPGVLQEEPFVDFATSRNRVLALHGEVTAFTIMPDSDDRLLGGEALRSFLVARRADPDPAYLTYLRRGDLSYFLPLVLRAAVGWRYHGAVHEHVGPVFGADSLAQTEIPGVQVVQDQTPRSLEASRRRWTRDLALLRAQLAQAPGDARVLFYLAQTYECLGQRAEAVQTYERRIEVGGWSEEVFESRLRRAKLLGELGRPWPDVQQAYLEAFGADPARAEPLVQIAQHWYDRDDHALTYLFARRAAELPRPRRLLFVDESAYEFRAADLAAISGFYLGGDARSEGGSLARRCVRARPSDERLRANWAFYAPAAGDQFRSFRARPLAYAPDPPFVAYNPSIYRDRGRWRCVARTSNYRVVDGKYVLLEGDVVQTRNIMLELDEDLEITRAVEMIDQAGVPRSTYRIHGFEDCRLFRHRDRLCCTATVCDFDLTRETEGPREMVILELSEDDYRITRATPLRGPWSDRPQKNWMPLLEETSEELRFVYAASPDGSRRSTTLRLVDGDVWGDVRVDANGAARYDAGRLRGSSQLIPTGDGWLGVTHSVAWPGGDARIYLHRFVLFSADLTIVAATEPFYFEQRGVEFCTGLARGDGDRLVVSYGIEDRRARLATLDLACVWRALREDLVI